MYVGVCMFKPKLIFQGEKYPRNMIASKWENWDKRNKKIFWHKKNVLYVNGSTWMDHHSSEWSNLNTEINLGFVFHSDMS